MIKNYKAIFVFLIGILLIASATGSSTMTYGINKHVSQGLSNNWAGYVSATDIHGPQTGSVTQVKGSWIVPAVDCTSTPDAYAGFWIGMDGYMSSTVEQAGTASDCEGNTAHYYAWYETYPKNAVILQMTVRPGDLMTAEVKYIGSEKYRITITDVTRAKTYSKDVRFAGAKRLSAEWIAEAPSSRNGVLPLADFGTVQFLNAQATINGHTGTINDPAWENDAMTMVDGSIVKAMPTVLSTDGTAFNVDWLHS